MCEGRQAGRQTESGRVCVDEGAKAVNKRGHRELWGKGWESPASRTGMKPKADERWNATTPSDGFVTSCRSSRRHRGFEAVSAPV